MRSLLLALVAVAGLSSCPSLGGGGVPLEPLQVATATLDSAQSSAAAFEAIYSSPDEFGVPLNARRAETWRQIGVALGVVSASLTLNGGDVGEAVREAYEALVPILQESDPETILWLTAVYAALDILRIAAQP